MNVEIGTEAAQFPEKESINWIFVAVYLSCAHETHVEPEGAAEPGGLQLGLAGGPIHNRY